MPCDNIYDIIVLSSNFIHNNAIILNIFYLPLNQNKKTY